MKITRLELLHVKPRWLFLKVHTDEGLVGLGEPVVEGCLMHPGGCCTGDLALTLPA